MVNNSPPGHNSAFWRAAEKPVVHGAGALLSQRLPRVAGDVRFRAVPAFDINQAAGVQHTIGLELLADVGQQFLRERRVEKNNVERCRAAGDKRCGSLRVADSPFAGVQLCQYRADTAQYVRVAVDEGAVGRAAGQGFDSQSAAAGEQIEAARANQVRLQPVEQGFTNAVCGRAQARCVRDRQSTPAPAAANNPHFTTRPMPFCGWFATCRHFVTLCRDGRIDAFPGVSPYSITVIMKFFKRKKPEPAPDDAAIDIKAEVPDEADAAPTVVAVPAERPTRPEAASDGFFTRLRRGLGRTSDNLVAGVGTLFLGRKEIDAELLEELESRLLMADVGVEATMQTIERLTQRVSRKELTQPEALGDALRDELFGILQPCEKPLEVTGYKPYVILMVGVNGVGKTTTIGKLAHRYRDQGLSVMLAAGDTFRAAAVEQLQVWGERNQVPVVAQHTGADSASVLFDALASAKARAFDVLIADTAGRLHNKENLMEELRKVVRVLRKQDPQAPHEVMLVLDAGTGQNALAQARHFTDAVGVTGITLTKLDGTAKGGIIFAIAQKLGLPIRFIGVGETADDLRPFAAREFIDALFDRE